MVYYLFTLAEYTPIFMKSFKILIFLFSLSLIQAKAQDNSMTSVIWQGDTAWASSKLKTMSLEEKLGQLFMVAAYSNKGPKHKAEILNLIEKHKIGGLIFFQGGPVRQAKLTNDYQKAANIPLMIAMDAEWGLAMRLDSTYKFPWPLTVGATKDNDLAYRMGEEIANHCQRLGVNVNFGPVVDINTNPNNPIINARSFGQDVINVTQLSDAYMCGMQDKHILACAKHFPGHGDTDKDSHKTLPSVNQDMMRMDSVELYPYRELINHGLASIMAAHLNVPAMDPSGKPSSLSNKIIGEYLKKKLNFNGLVFTDALNMGGVANKYAPGEVDVEALLAGNDILLFSMDVPIAILKIKEAIAAGKITELEINKRVFKILTAKSWMGLEVKKYVDPKLIIQDLNPASAEVLTRNIYSKAITVVKNRNHLIPVRDLGKKKIACITGGVNPGTEFHKTLKYYAEVDHYSFGKISDAQLLSKLADYDLVIVGVYTSNANPWKSFKVSGKLRSFVKKLALQNDIIVNLFANPYSLKYFPETEFAKSVMVSYQNHPAAESIAAQVIFGAQGSNGELPVSSTELYEMGFGLKTKSLKRLGYGIPEEVGLDALKLQKIDDLVKEAIRSRATPGCQVLVARRGKVVYQKAFGHHTYKKKRDVNLYDIYDLASITKMAASVPLLMKLTEEGKLDLDKKLSDYLPEAIGTNKENLILREIFAHQARLKPWIPFYQETIKPETFDDYYSSKRSFNYPNVVAKDMFARRSMRDTILARILASKLLTKKEYKYSDLGYYLLMQIIEDIEGEKIENLVKKEFYNEIGAYTMTFKPLEFFNEDLIVPTENDKIFRKQTLKGNVHDQGAAMLGGVAGHAGLFSNANDLAKMMQMYMQYGEYGGHRFLDSITVQEFIRCQYCATKNRRGIGFDKPQIEGPGPASDLASKASFGHSGFTGTLAWADPEEDLVYIFLSNRVFPDAENRKLLSLSTRTRIQDVIYNSIKNEKDIIPIVTDIEP